MGRIGVVLYVVVKLIKGVLAVGKEEWFQTKQAVEYSLDRSSVIKKISVVTRSKWSFFELYHQ